MADLAQSLVVGGVALIGSVIASFTALESIKRQHASVALREDATRNRREERTGALFVEFIRPIYLSCKIREDAKSPISQEVLADVEKLERIADDPALLLDLSPDAIHKVHSIVRRAQGDRKELSSGLLDPLSSKVMKLSAADALAALGDTMWLDNAAKGSPPPPPPVPPASGA